ncbi:heterokaryon incompatibility protein-domain-containing protein, partial [Boeremia exigua]|uniref:heterokaryon incompatibility protein-domain-containing protein n=1 Tax=Boeremia exigua TaxID=749465 RepID=UPI001E8CFADC
LDTTQKQIRLLRLRHRAHHGHLPQYELHTFDLENAPNYIALSYTWGPAFPNYPIRVNRRKLHIRANLHAFLQGFAGRGYIWIDQICIDQSNPEEKNHQVRMMAQIYRDCDSMIIWLGSKDHAFREAADEFIYKQRPHSLSVLLHDDYFTRLWVVQEVLLARAVRIICRGMSGHVEIPWNDVHAVATGSARWLQQHGHTKAVLALIANQGMNRYEGLRLTIARFAGYECENPRDKVYGLLGIVKPKERLEVDYTKSVQDVFLDAAR